MTTFYTLHLSHHVPGMVKGPVKAVPSVTSYGGQYRECEKDFMRPDMAAIRECLPARYRKAWDRENSIWFSRDDSDKPAHVTLRDYRGRYLNTVYAQPYDLSV